MKIEEIEKARQKFKTLEQEREKLIKIKKRITELSEDQKVSEFIELCNELNLLKTLEIPSKEDIAYEAFAHVAQNSQNPLSVYLYLGLREDKNHSYLGYSFKLTDDERRIYRNLDTGDTYYNYPQKKEAFKKNNVIINCFSNSPDEQFKIFQSQYFLNLTEGTQEEALEKTVKSFQRK